MGETTPQPTAMNGSDALTLDVGEKEGVHDGSTGLFFPWRQAPPSHLHGLGGAIRYRKPVSLAGTQVKVRTCLTLTKMFLRAGPGEPLCLLHRI